MIAWLRLLFQPWHHLGHVEIGFTSGDGDKVVGRCTVHFYAKGADLRKRRAEAVGTAGHDWKRHVYYQQGVVPWLNGGNLYAIKEPSDWFKDYVLRTTGYKYMGDKWVKPAPPVTREGNVVAMVKVVPTDG